NWIAIAFPLLLVRCGLPVLEAALEATPESGAHIEEQGREHSPDDSHDRVGPTPGHGSPEWGCELDRTSDAADGSNGLAHGQAKPDQRDFRIAEVTAATACVVRRVLFVLHGSHKVSIAQGIALAARQRS